MPAMFSHYLRFILLAAVAQTSLSFVLSPSPSSATLNVGNQHHHCKTSLLPLHAKKNSKPKKGASNKNKNLSTAGFGGAATAPCPCGSNLGYMKCCGKLHKDPKVFAEAAAEQVVRARYSAYAKREVDFIVGSTHPLNEKFVSDIEHWKEQIRINCYDNFELTSCEIVDETYEGEGDKQIAKVKFIAKMIQVDSREKTAFMETSTFERAGKHIANGAWLYKEGFIETAPGMPQPVDEEEEEEEEGKEDEAGDGEENNESK